MSRQSSAWMPLYVGDYLGDTQRLTTEQHGAYLLLILDYWRNGPAPDDDAVLQQITKLDRAAWKKHRAALSRLFRVEGGEWRHKRIDRELEEAEANAERRSSKAKAAAEARWGGCKGNAPSNARSMPQAMPVECPPQSPSPIEEEPSGSPSNFPSSPRLSDDFDAFWKAYPRRVGKEDARKAWAACIKRGVKPWHIIEGAQWLADHPPDDPQFIPHPSTWLNKGRYDDERTEHARQPVAGNRGAPVGGYRRSIGLDMLRAAADEAGFDWSGTPKPDGGA